MRVSCFAVLILCIAATPRLDGAHAREVLQSLIDQPDDSLLPSVPETMLSVEASGLQADDVMAALPLALRCLQSSRPKLRPYGLAFMFWVAMSPDGSQRLEPYAGEIAPFLEDTDHAFRRAAIAILGAASPKPSQQGVKYLSAHLRDTSNTGDEVALIASSIFNSERDPTTVRAVLDVIRNRKDQKLTSSMIRVVGLDNIQTDVALSFIREGFADPSPDVRAAAVDAVSRMPEGLKSTFEAELRHVLSNPDELDQTRARAQAVLTGH